MKDLAVVIPVYRELFEHNELISLQQAVRCFDGYDLFFLAPEGLQVKENIDLEYKYFPIKFFESVRSYSNLMLTKELYGSFSEYKYILVYQLDSFVFDRNIKSFIDLGYDYIGAPTLEGMYKPYRSEKILFTQNGGFSLRRVSAFINWCEANEQEIALMKIYDDEDSIIYALRSKGLKLAPINIALQFSFDSNVRECFKRNNMSLPFGCHAWERYDYEFWEPFIKEQGYDPIFPEEGRRIIKNYYAINKYNTSWIEKYSSDKVYEVILSLLPGFDNKVYVWGMGRHGYDAMQLLLGAGIEILAFLDSNPEKINEGMFPCPAISVKKAIYENLNIPIVVAMYNPVDACVYLENYGLRHRKNYITYMELYEAFEIETMKG